MKINTLLLTLCLSLPAAAQVYRLELEVMDMQINGGYISRRTEVLFGAVGDTTFFAVPDLGRWFKFIDVKPNDNDRDTLLYHQMMALQAESEPSDVLRLMRDVSDGYLYYVRVLTKESGVLISIVNLDMRVPSLMMTTIPK